MKALIFTFVDIESTTRADAIARILGESNWEVAVCDYTLAGAFKPSRLVRTQKFALLTLMDLGFDSVPQLSARQYENAFGDDIDFSAISGLTFYSADYPNNFPFSQTFLNTESLYYQRLRGIAARVDQLLRAIKPDLVIVQQGSEVVSRIIASKAHKFSIAKLCSESSFFSGHFLLDPVGQHFLSGVNKIDKDWPAVSLQPLTTQEAKGVAQFIHNWKADKATKYPQVTRPDERMRLEKFLKSGDGPILFVPMQVPLDANVFHSIGAFPTLEDFYQSIINGLPLNWRAVFKRHPKDTVSRGLPRLPNSNVLLVDEISIHDLIVAADAVALFSSNVGLETLLYGKPVIVGGRPCYGGKGLTIDVQSSRELPHALEQALNWQPDKELRDRLLNYLLNDYLIRNEDSPALLRRIEETRSVMQITDPRCPYSECDPPVVAEYTEFIRRYDNLAKHNLMAPDVLRRIDIPGFCTRPDVCSDLGSGERQTSAWVTRIEHGHLSRYAFVASVINPGQKVLDIACGVGYGAYMLADRCQAQVTAVDGSHDSIAYAQANWAHPGIDYRTASAGSFFTHDGSAEYDVIVSFETIEHLRDASLFLKQAWEKLRPGGVLFVSTPNSDVYLLMNHPFHVEHFDESELRALLRSLGKVSQCLIAWQSQNTVDARPSHDSRFLIGVLFKEPQGMAWAIDPQALQPQMPFTYTPPAREFSRLMDVVRMMARRKKWLIYLIRRWVFGTK